MSVTHVHASHLLFLLTGCYTGSHEIICSVQFSSVQSLSRVWLFATPWIEARQASLSITNFRSSLRFTSIESLMPSNHLIHCHPFLILPSIFPSIRLFSKESVLCIRWPKYWSFSFSISSFYESSELISFRTELVWSPCSPRNSQESSLTPHITIAYPIFPKTTARLLGHGTSNS